MILAYADNPHERFFLRVEALLVVSIAFAKELDLLKHVLDLLRTQRLPLQPRTAASQALGGSCRRVRSYWPKKANRAAASGEHSHKGDNTEDVLTHGSTEAREASDFTGSIATRATTPKMFLRMAL